MKNNSSLLQDMRRFFAIFIAITLLVVSSVPMVSDAASCELPVHELAMADDMDHTPLSEAFPHLMDADLPLNRIECGCGCHRTIDALPHLLAPHVFAVVVPLSDVNAVSLIASVASQLNFTEVRVPVPPPRV